ncbi:HAD hydrolase-like protein [Oerskovia sp. M15]
MYHLAVERAGASAPLVVGDRLDTDLAGARSGGYPGCTS